MIPVVLALLGVSMASGPTPTPTPVAGPTFCVEWIHQSTEGYDRLTLFRDRMLVWKTHRGEHESIKRERLNESEAQYYCDYFEREEFWSIPPDLRTGMLSDLAGESAVTLARRSGNRKTIRYDDLSSHTAASAALRAALEGLKGIFLSPLAPASRYTADVLTPGTLLKRFDGTVFRVGRLEKETGFVEIVGVTEPYSQFVKIEELRFSFAPPEPAP